MKKTLLLFFFWFISGLILLAQVGIGTTNPQGALDVVSPNQGIVVPRVSSIENVTDGNGNFAIDGTIVYDTSRSKICYRVDGSWICIGKDSDGNSEMGITNPVFTTITNYIKASNTDNNDGFGSSISISSDGTRLAVGARQESSNATGINGDQTDNSAFNSGAVYIFRRSGSVWEQEAYIKASNTNSSDGFSTVSLSSDSTRLAVGAFLEDTSASNSGALYIFRRTGTTWIQEAYIKASNVEADDSFGYSVSMNTDGSRVAVSSISEDSSATGIGGDESNNSASASGAAYVFSRSGTTWSQEAYFKASNTESNDQFGYYLSLSGDGSRLAVSARNERSNATGINGDQTNNSASSAGAVYMFVRIGVTWTQEAYIKASNTEASDLFGFKLDLSNDGMYLAVTSISERSNATGVNGDETDNSTSGAGAVYVYSRSGTTWVQEAYVKASNTELSDSFGYSVSFNSDGSRMAVGAFNEDSNATGIGGDQTDNSVSSSGAVYVFSRSGTTWAQEAYVKASNTGFSDSFGQTLNLSGNGAYLVIGARGEDSNAIGVNGDQTNNSSSNAGAIYIIE